MLSKTYKNVSRDLVNCVIYKNGGGILSEIMAWTESEDFQENDEEDAVVKTPELLEQVITAEISEKPKILRAQSAKKLDSGKSGSYYRMFISKQKLV